MAVGDEQRLITPISQRQFELYALSLERGPNFDPAQVFGSYQAGRGSASGCILLDPEGGTFTALALRRRVDHRWVRVDEGGPFPTPEAALDHLSISMRAGEPPEPLPPGARRRPLLLKTGSRGTSPEFDLLTSTISHLPALMALGECYLALPNPDANFVTDLQTNNFASRLFELYLLACFREQGLIVRQEHVSPDFLIENDDAACWIEAVTANSETPRSGGIGDWVHAPVDRNERMIGAPAERFAKTLRGKLQRNYHELDHVKGMPFALAIADFHESGSMVWSREALPTYLYGLRADVEGEGAGRRAIGTPINNLTGKHGIPAGLFRDPEFAHLSAVIFSNAATLAKFNRMGFLAGWRPPGLTMSRRGILYDRTPGALEPIDFDLSVDSAEYQALWPWGEAWCQELEVFHNPQATRPIPFDLIPGATHWFERGGDIECRTMWANSVISSITHLRMAGEPGETSDARSEGQRP
ncbi:hypothetical protein M2189_008227 [Bradyrhizobium japonicum]|uniref:hypothetical protein n=1 Tax=Bradyrhizobium japonicum TaxID=375 RepID=UPI0021673ECA|nr:hypothetical protein [Bradyrhizobium japonicum]MCS3502262.1 hypothetical protein [Bradyrhizobium japonicum]MCS3965024.1 hypothetical protein [Bradyrhizobium japonicum]MCS3997331.1 hypothetical protein [Bradyrhizobium japonicum]